jgi:hypothetical protein
MEAPTARRRLQEGLIPSSIANLSAGCLKIAMERPFGWEHLLFSRVLRDEIDALSDIERDLKFDIRLGPVRFLPIQEAFAWLDVQNQRVLRIIKSGETLVNVALPEALGPPGKPGDPELLVYVARRMGAVCKELLQWKQDFSEVEVHQELGQLFLLISNFTKDALDNWQRFPDEIDSAIVDARAARDRGEKFSRDLKFTLRTVWTPELQAEFARVNDLISNGARG